MNTIHMKLVKNVPDVKLIQSKILENLKMKRLASLEETKAVSSLSEEQQLIFKQLQSQSMSISRNISLKRDTEESDSESDLSEEAQEILLNDMDFNEMDESKIDEM